MKWKEQMLAAAEAEGACDDGYRWLKHQKDPMCLLSDESVLHEYMRWAIASAEYHGGLLKYLTPTPEWLERGLTHENRTIRFEWAYRSDLPLTPAQYERGLSDPDDLVRLGYMERADFEPTPEQMERGLQDTHWSIRYLLAYRFDVPHTPSQIGRGLMDEDRDVRNAFKDLKFYMDANSEREANQAKLDQTNKEKL